MQVSNPTPVSEGQKAICTLLNCKESFDEHCSSDFQKVHSVRISTDKEGSIILQKKNTIGRLSPRVHHRVLQIFEQINQLEAQCFYQTLKEVAQKKNISATDAYNHLTIAVKALNTLCIALTTEKGWKICAIHHLPPTPRILKAQREKAINKSRYNGVLSGSSEGSSDQQTSSKEEIERLKRDNARLRAEVKQLSSELRRLKPRDNELNQSTSSPTS